jgi:predicted dienelactone hydrolase
MLRRIALGAAASVLLASAAAAGTVGELHRVAMEPTAGLRDARHRTDLRLTIWYPAAADAVEQPVVIGPPGRPLFEAGAAAPDAAFAADGKRHPIVLLSHGFGGTGRVMGWLGIPLARQGFVVVAVDHPGNNALDAMTLPGAILWWDRAEDLRSALAAVTRDPLIGPHLDAARVGVAGFSAGGFTALVAAGARVDRNRLVQFCASHPDDAGCAPQPEFPTSPADIEKALAVPELQAEVAHAGDDHSVPQVRAAFVMAPGLVQALDPASLAGLRLPVEIMLGDADGSAPPATNGLVAARLIPGAGLSLLHGVGHYDFLASCTDAARSTLPWCPTPVPQADTHAKAVAAAAALFGRSLGPAD